MQDDWYSSALLVVGLERLIKTFVTQGYNDL